MIIKVTKHDHTQKTLDNEQLEQKIIRNKNSIEIDLYDTTKPNIVNEGEDK